MSFLTIQLNITFLRSGSTKTSHETVAENQNLKKSSKPLFKICILNFQSLVEFDNFLNI